MENRLNKNNKKSNKKGFGIQNIWEDYQNIFNGIDSDKIIYNFIKIQLFEKCKTNRWGLMIGKKKLNNLSKRTKLK